VGPGTATFGSQTRDSWTCFFPPPTAPHFDKTAEAWIFSRYEDVLAALREPALGQAGPQAPAQTVRTEVGDVLPASRIEAWLAAIDPLTDRLDDVPRRGAPVDLLPQVIRPWCLALAATILKIGPGDARSLSGLAPYLSGGDESSGGLRRRVADWRAGRILARMNVPGARSAFLGVTQTLFNFVANAWDALLENPTQAAILRDDPNLAPRAVEELLRYAGPVHTLIRRAAAAVCIADTKIPAGDRVVLRIGSANRDPARFADPNFLDVTCRSAGHLALGSGTHGCVGALLVRMASESAVRNFAEKAAGLELAGPVPWRCGTTLRIPQALRVVGRKA
jgi:cytochrome P450